jgi:hypothetical protein
MLPARLLGIAVGTPFAARTGAREPRLWHAHYLLSHAVRLLLVAVSRHVDREFRLYRSLARSMYESPEKIALDAK